MGVSASASVLPVNIQDWFLLGLTYLISLLSKGVSKVFSNTTGQKPRPEAKIPYIPAPLVEAYLAHLRVRKLTFFVRVKDVMKVKVLVSQSFPTLCDPHRL